MKRLKINFFSQKGQVGLIAILVMVVGLTVGLGLASRSVSDISISETEEKSLRAFNAAEAGIEELLKETSLISGSTTVDGLNVDLTVTENNSLTTTLEQNETAEVNLQGATASNVRISWVDTSDSAENPGTCTEGDGTAPASLEIIKYRAMVSGGNVIAVEPYHYLYNSKNCSISNGFQNPSGAGGSYRTQVSIPITSADGILRIRPIYNKTTIEVVGIGGALPAQKYDIVSEAADTQTGEKRTVSASRTVKAWPEIFDYAMFSGTSIAK